MFDFTDKVVVVGGASGNLGGAVVRAFADAGASVVLVDYAAERLPGLFPELVDVPKHLFCGPCDVADADSVDETLQEILDRYSRIDVFANTIGGYRPGAPLVETPISTWEFLINLNARSVFITSRAMLPAMLEQGSGKMIHVSARAGMHGAANVAAYAAAKSAVIRLVESIAEEVKNDGINVNCILPGTIDTPPNRVAQPDADYSRWVTPEAIADVFTFLASDAARAIHGAAIPVYGRS